MTTAPSMGRTGVLKERLFVTSRSEPVAPPWKDGARPRQSPDPEVAP